MAWRRKVHQGTFFIDDGNSRSYAYYLCLWGMYIFSRSNVIYNVAIAILYSNPYRYRYMFDREVVRAYVIATPEFGIFTLILQYNNIETTND